MTAACQWHTWPPVALFCLFLIEETALTSLPNFSYLWGRIHFTLLLPRGLLWLLSHFLWPRPPTRLPFAAPVPPGVSEGSSECTGLPLVTRLMASYLTDRSDRVRAQMRADNTQDTLAQLLCPAPPPSRGPVASALRGYGILPRRPITLLYHP